MSARKHVVKGHTVVIHSDATDSEVMLLAAPFVRAGDLDSRPEWSSLGSDSPLGRTFPAAHLIF